MNLEQLRGKLLYQAVLLGGVALLTSGVLAVASKATEADIRAAEILDLKQSLAIVLPGQYDNDITQDTVLLPGPEGEVTVYRARHAGKVEAVVYRVIGHGYAGPIICVMGVSSDGKILGVRVLKHSETPGLGDKIDALKAKWIFDFDGKYLGNPPLEKWAVKKDGGVFDQFAGVTITPRGVVKAVKGGLEFFDQQRAPMFADNVAAGGQK